MCVWVCVGVCVCTSLPLVGLRSPITKSVCVCVCVCVCASLSGRVEQSNN